MPDPGPRFTISPRGTALILAGMVAALGITSLVTQILRIHYNMRAVGLIITFDMNREANVPTLFSALLLLCAASLLWVIARGVAEQGRDYRWHWKLLSIVFFYLAVDEAVGIHELFIVPLRSAFNATGVFYFTWVVPGIAVVIGLGIYYLKFLGHLAFVDRFRFVLAGSVYVGGAIGVEMAGGRYYWLTDRSKDFTYALFTILEEMLEMAGITLFIFALLDYMARHHPDFAIRVEGAATKKACPDRA